MDESISEAEANSDAEEPVSEDQAAAAGEQGASGAPAENSPAGDVQSPEYEELSETAGTGASARPSLDIVLDVPVTVSLEVGKATMSVGELIKLGQGAVVELDRAVGEPLDVMVNGALVAHGEIVLVNEKFGIRLTSVVADGAHEREAG